MLDALDQRGHQELVALDALRVIAQAKVLSRAPECQRLPAVDVVPVPRAGSGPETGSSTAWGRHTFDAVQRVDDLLEAD